jgi:hypothetical protein
MNRPRITPTSTASDPVAKTIGIVEAAAVAAVADVEAPMAMISATWRRTRSAASSGQSLVLAVRDAVFDGQVSPLDKASFLWTLPNRHDRLGV